MSEFDYKKLTKEQLDWAFKEVSFKIPPMWHQLASLSFGLTQNRIMFPHDVGTGKTLTALWLSELWGCKRILVVCPTSAFSAWFRDVKQTDFSSMLIEGSSNERKVKMQSNNNLTVCHYEGLKTVFGHKLKNDGWVVSIQSLNEYGIFDLVIFDEVHRVNNYRSLQSQICFELSKRTRFAIGMSGTPIDKVLLELYNIYHVIDLGRTLGNSFFHYRNTYFYKRGYEWKLKIGAKQKILDKLSANTISFSRNECFDLPECREDEVVLQPTKEFCDLQNKIVNSESVKLKGKSYVFGNVSVIATKLRQLSGGMLYLKDDETEGLDVYLLKQNPKLEALMDLVEGTGEKLLVFYNFAKAGDFIAEELSKKGILFSRLYGGQNTQDRLEQERGFREDENVKVCLAHPACGAEGFDGTVAGITVFFDPIASPRIRKQAIGRMHRKGQEKKTLVIDLMLSDSIDFTIAKHREGRTNFVEDVMKYIQRNQK